MTLVRPNVSRTCSSSAGSGRCAAQHAAGEGGQGLPPRPGARGLPGAAGGEVDDRADTATATRRNASRANRFSRSAMVNWCSGGVKK